MNENRNTTLSINMIRILIVEPGKHPYHKTIPHTLEALQKTVGGYIQAVYPWDTACALVCFEDAKLQGAPLNRALRDENGRVYDIVAGTFFICGLDDEDFADLSDELADRYMQLFRNPEAFCRTPAGIAVIPIDAEGWAAPSVMKD